MFYWLGGFLYWSSGKIRSYPEHKDCFVDSEIEFVSVAESSGERVRVWAQNVSLKESGRAPRRSKKLTHCKFEEKIWKGKDKVTDSDCFRVLSLLSFEK